MPNATIRRENPGGVTATITASHRVIGTVEVGNGGGINATLDIGTPGDR